MDQLPVGPAPDAPLPTRASLSLLVGRVTTIKLAYWAALTAFEVLLPFLVPRPFAERFPISVGAAVIISTLALVWSVRMGRLSDRHAGPLMRSIPTVATTFAATTVVASPASLPLLILERERSLEACSFGTCHGEALLLWIAILAIGTLFIPVAFAAGLHPGGARSVGR